MSLQAEPHVPVVSPPRGEVAPGVAGAPAAETLSIADQILAADDIERETMEVPEWNVTLMLRSPTAFDRSRMQIKYAAAQKDGAQVDMSYLYSEVIALCAVDPATDEPVFGNDQGTLAALSRKNGAVVERVATRCMHLLGMGREDIDEKKGGS